MTADYPLRDGVSDRHSALLVVSAGSEAGSLVSRAYTDGGGLRDYRLERTADGFVFDDRVPHDAKAVRARKLLRPTSTGYEEILEVDRGEGEFTPYSEIAFRRSEP